MISGDEGSDERTIMNNRITPPRVENRNAALDRDGHVWAQGGYTDLWRCLTTGDYGPVLYNVLCAERGPIRTVVPATEKYQPVR